MINLITGQSWWSPAEGVGARGVALQARHTHLCYHIVNRITQPGTLIVIVSASLDQCPTAVRYACMTAGARVSVNIHKT